ncbi:MAG: hypothetical protein K2P51_03250 [Rhabdochlamydiaceae bacterium]|nr:hypothetical protein [Rhabdochlamydiaceae bacterium]
MIKISFSLLLFVCSLLAGCSNSAYHTPYIISDVSDEGGVRHDTLK